jgi:hypothetical protein
MFDLEKSIAAWREEMIRAGITQRDVLDELESHLREDVARQVGSGATEEAAFANASERIGQAKKLKREFAKNVRTGSVWLQKLKHGLAVFLGSRPAVFAGIPMPALEAFSVNARGALEQARAEAAGLHHDFIGTEHVLLGLFHEDNSTVREVLSRMGVGREKVREEIVKWVAEGPQRKAVSVIPYTPRARQALALAAGEAKSQHRAHIGAEHILLGLLREGGGVAALVLKNLGVDVEKTRAEILRGIS